jgi:hypothetical protein
MLILNFKGMLGNHPPLELREVEKHILVAFQSRKIFLQILVTYQQTDLNRSIQI